MPKIDGPRLTVKATCSDCKHMESERFRCEDDTGNDVYCTFTGVRIFIRSYSWGTPGWCPLMTGALEALIVDLKSKTPPAGTDRRRSCKEIGG